MAGDIEDYGIAGGTRQKRHFAWVISLLMQNKRK